MVKNSRMETVLNKSYQEMAERYGIAIFSARPRSSKDKAFVEISVARAAIYRDYMKKYRKEKLHIQDE